MLMWKRLHAFIRREERISQIYPSDTPRDRMILNSVFHCPAVWNRAFPFLLFFSRYNDFIVRMLQNLSSIVLARHRRLTISAAFTDVPCLIRHGVNLQ
jgi:hypothetical protein